MPTTALAKKILQKRFLAKRRRRRNNHDKRASRGCMQNLAYADEVTPRKAQRDTVMRSIYKGKRRFIYV